MLSAKSSEIIFYHLYNKLGYQQDFIMLSCR